MNIYEKYCLPHLINWACSLKPIVQQRLKVVPLAEGRVLEVGMGAALNLPYYAPNKVDLVWGLEPSAAMRRSAGKNLERAAINVQWLPLSASEIPLDDGAADTVLLTFTLCTIPDWQSALREMRRVLKPEGKLIFCEHGAAPDESIFKWQRRISPLWKKVAGGCHLDRPIPNYLQQAGFRIVTMESGYVDGVPRLAGYEYWGTAMRS